MNLNVREMRTMMVSRDHDVAEDQRVIWDDLRKLINRMLNIASESNVKRVAETLVSKNLIWGRGLFCRAVLKNLLSSSTSAPVLAALVAIVNSKFPDVGYLLLKRILFEAKIAYEGNDKVQLLPLAKFLAHLVNQSVAHEIVGLEFLFLVLQDHIPSKESIEIAVSFVKDCGSALREYNPGGIRYVFERFQEILHEGGSDNFSESCIEGLFAVRKSNFLNYLDLHSELDIVEPDDQVTHEISYYHELDPEIALDVFQPILTSAV